jgi:tRNA nucleotidyltransferase/poly(A) polymerase
MKTFTTQLQRAEMVPPQVRTLLELLNLSPDHGDHARVAGGAVRDALLGVTPKDWDVATVLLPTTVTVMAERAGYGVIPTGLQHGTVTVVVDGMPLEVTTLRTDVETDGRHAEVEFVTDWKEDAARRDLTMNAMFMTLDGYVHDFFGGVDDLWDGRVRFVGHAADRIEEDFLRILRFFRFAGRMAVANFDVEALRAIKRLSPNLHRISGERVWMEMSKILSGNCVREVLERMQHAGVLEAVGVHHPNLNLAFTASTMGGKPETILAALVDNPLAAETVADAWKLSRDERKTLAFVSRRAPEAFMMSLMDWKKCAVVEGKELAMEALCMTTRKGWQNVLADWAVPVFPLTGADILSLGVEPGPEVGRRMRALKQQWLDSEFTLNARKLVQLAASV